MRRFVTVGLMSGTLALSALVGSGAVGATSPWQEEHGSTATTIVTVDSVVPLISTSVTTLPVTTRDFDRDLRT